MKLCGFVLAAGLGTRIRPLFPDLPKPLVPVGGRPAIAWSMDLLARAGVSRIVVNVHHRREMMRAALPGLSPPGVELLISEEETLLGTGGGIANARELFSGYDWLLVVNADILTSLSLRPLWRRAVREESEAHLILSPRGPKSEQGRIGRASSGDLWLAPPRGGGDGSPRAISPGVRPGVFLGVQMVRPEIFRGVDPAKAPSVIDLYRERIAAGGRVRASFTESFWVDLGTEDGYRRGQRYLEGEEDPAPPAEG